MEVIKNASELVDIRLIKPLEKNSVSLNMSGR